MSDCDAGPNIFYFKKLHTTGQILENRDCMEGQVIVEITVFFNVAELLIVSGMLFQFLRKCLNTNRKVKLRKRKSWAI